MNRNQEILVEEVNVGGAGKAARRRRNRQRRKLRKQLLLSTRVNPSGFPRMRGIQRRVASGAAQLQRRIDAYEAQGLRNPGLASSMSQQMAMNLSKGASVARAVSQKVSLSEEYAHIQGAIVAPQICPPERYSTEYSSNPTAIANPWFIEDYPWSSANNPTTPQLAASELFLCIFRDPLRHVVFHDENLAGATYTYLALMTPISGPSVDPVASLPTPDVSEFDEDLIVPRWVADTPYSPHGTYLYSGSDDRTEKTYVWFDKDETLGINVNLTGASTAWGITVTLDRFEDDTVVQNAIVDSASGTDNNPTITVTVDKAGYYSIHVNYTLGTPTSTGALTMFKSGVGSVFCHRPLPFFETNRLAIDGIRIVGVSGMYSNNAAAIQKAGTITGLQVPKETDWQQFIGSLSLVSKNVNAHTIPIENGLYGFLRTTEAEDLELIDVFGNNPVSGALTASYFTLRNPKSYLILRGSIPPVDGRSGFITVATSLEYMTTDVWRQTDTPRTQPDLYKKALAEIKTIQQWHENPLHIKELFKKVLSGASSVISSVQKYAPQALTIAEILGSMLA